MVLTLFLLVTLGMSYGQGIFDPCYFWPGSVYAGSGQCFKLIDDPKSFTDARADCVTEGAALAEVRSQQQMDTADSLVSGLGVAWLGALIPSGGTPQLTWLSDQPGWYGVGELCFGINLNSATDLVTYNCSGHMAYICQIFSHNPCDVYLPGAEYHENSCFLPVNTSLSLHDATTYCANVDSIIVEPRTPDLKAYLSQFTRWYLESADAVWLGLAQHNSTTFKWRSTGELVSRDNWTLGVSGSYGLTAPFAAVMNGDSSRTWEVIAQFDLAQVVCHRDLTPECSGVFSSGRCLVMYNDAPYWTDAKAACQAEGSYLAEPKTELLARTVERFILDTSNTPTVYLGATDLETEGDWIWDFSRENMANTYSAWARKQPDNTNKREHYLAYVAFYGGWIDYVIDGGTANLPDHYICERVVQVYLHSYVVVVPAFGWGGPKFGVRARIGVASLPGQNGHNYVKFSVYPGGQVKTISLLGSDHFLYVITDLDVMGLNITGVQQKYVRVQSTHPLDVIFFYYGKWGKYACAIPVLEDSMTGRSNTFFFNPGQMDNTLALVSTELLPSTVDVVLTPDNETVAFYVKDVYTEIRNVFSMSTTLLGRYQSLYVDSISGSTTGQLTHSTGALNLYRFEREHENTTHDASCDQILPVSMIGRDYITFPYLPFNADITDYFTVVAVYRDTTITVYRQDPTVPPRTVTLQWPGDIYNLELPATSFHHVNGTKEFYLYARLIGKSSGAKDLHGLCSLALVHDGLFRESYQVNIIYFVSFMHDAYVVVIVRTEDKGSVVTVSSSGVNSSPDVCQDVPDTVWSGCYFHLPALQSNQVYQVKMNPPSTSTFGAYFFANRRNDEVCVDFCYNLGMNQALPEYTEFDFNEYKANIESNQVCEKGTSTITTTTKPTTTTATITKAATSEIPSIQHTKQPVDSTTTENVVSTFEMTTAASQALDIALSTNEVLTSHPTEKTNPIVASDITSTESPCAERNNTIALTKVELEEVLRHITAHLSVTTDDLSKVRRSQTSEPDHRASSTILGLFSIAFICLTLGLILVSDLSTLIYHVATADFKTLSR